MGRDDDITRLVVLTGGSHCGKTSVLAELARRGRRVLTEAAIDVIRDLTEAHGLAGQAAWRSANQVEFQRLILDLQLQREAAAQAAGESTVVCDRGLLDGIVYSALQGLEWPAEMLRLTAGVEYAHVFVLENLSGFDPREQTGRVHTHEESVRATVMLENIYREHGFVLTRLPEMPVEARADHVDQVLDRLA